MLSEQEATAAMEEVRKFLHRYGFDLKIKARRDLVHAFRNNQSWSWASSPAAQLELKLYYAGDWMRVSTFDLPGSQLEEALNRRINYGERLHRSHPNPTALAARLTSST